MADTVNVIFFGSSSDSVIICDALLNHSEKLGITLKAVVTQLPKPVGRKHILTPTPVELWATSHAITSLAFETQQDKPWNYTDENRVIQTLETESPDLLISASYGQKIPEMLLKKARFGGINVHPSLLPRWRGTDPVPWTILAGDAQTGVTIVTLSQKFDEGKILAQQKIPTPPKETPAEIRKRLFTLGAPLLTRILPKYCTGKHMGTIQNEEHKTHARRLSKNDGFIPWNFITQALQGISIPKNAYPEILKITETTLSKSIVRAVRALSPWPGIWSMFGDTRIKILETHEENGKLVVETVQLEGKNPVPFTTFQHAYHFTLDNKDA